MKTLDEIESLAGSAFGFGVLDRDFRGHSDTERIPDDWQTWLISALGRHGQVVVPDGGRWLGLATEPEVVGADGRAIVAGTPIVEIGFLSPGEMEAWYAWLGDEQVVQRRHPWYRLGEYRGYVTLRRLESATQVYAIGRLIEERSWGRIHFPYADGFVDPLEPREHPLSDLLQDRFGFSCVHGPGSLQSLYSAFDSERFGAPIVEELNAILRRLGIGTRAEVRDVEHLADDATLFRIATPVRDLVGHPILDAARILETESIDLWHQRLHCFAEFGNRG